LEWASYTEVESLEVEDVSSSKSRKSNEGTLGLFTIPHLPSIEDNYITLHNFIQILKQNVCPGGCSVLLYWFAKVVHELRLHTSPFFTCLKYKVLVAYLYITELATRTAKPLSCFLLFSMDRYTTTMNILFCSSDLKVEL